MGDDVTKPEEYDVVILGSGAAGKLISWTLASEGRRTAVIERRYVGGSCPNIACLPSKNVIHSRQGRLAPSEGPRSSGSWVAAGRSTCPPCAIASA